MSKVLPPNPLPPGSPSTPPPQSATAIPITPESLVQHYLGQVGPAIYNFLNGTRTLQPQAPPIAQAPQALPKPTYDTIVPQARQTEYQSWLAQLPANLQQGGSRDYDLQGAFMAGAQPQAGHLTDQFKKPNHMTFSNESQYSGRNGEVGGEWRQSGQRWIFYASPTNLKYHSAEELKDYFKKYEPGNKLVLPQ